MMKNKTLKAMLKFGEWIATALYGIIFLGCFAFVLKAMWLAVKFGWDLI